MRTRAFSSSSEDEDSEARGLSAVSTLSVAGLTEVGPRAAGNSNSTTGVAASIRHDELKKRCNRLAQELEAALSQQEELKR